MKQNKEKRNFYTETTFLLLALMVVVSLVGVSIFRIQYKKNNLTEDTQDYRQYDRYFAMITSDDRAEFWQAVYQGAKAEGDADGIYVELFAGNIGTGYTMEQRMEIAIASDVDGILIEGEESMSLYRQIRQAVEKGIPVVVVSQDMPDSDRISFVGTSRYDLGRSYGKETCKLALQMLEEKSEAGETDTGLNVMVLVSQESESSGQNLLLSGIREEIAKEKQLAGVVQIGTYAVDDSGAFTAEESIRDLFIGQDEVPDILICLSEIHTNCAYQAVIDYNRVGKTNIIGYYDSETILNAVSKEVIFSTISMDTTQMGQYCVDALADYLGEGYVSEYYAVDTYVVGQDNIDEYLKGEKE